MPTAVLKYSPVALDMIGAIHRYITYELKNPAGADHMIAVTRSVSFAEAPFHLASHFS
jgi:hypothetical protein